MFTKDSACIIFVIERNVKREFDKIWVSCDNCIYQYIHEYIDNTENRGDLFMLTRAELKQQAKEQLKGNLGMLFLCTLIVTAISFVIALIPVVGTVATYIIAPPLSLGLIMVYLSVTYGEKVEIGTLFNGFQCFGKSILLYILITIFTLLWSLLFIIPGIIKAYSYSMAFYI